MRRKNKECILVILLQSIYTPVVNIHAFTQLSHFCNSIDTIEPLFKKGLDCSSLSVYIGFWSRFCIYLKNTTYNITCLTRIRLGGGGTQGSIVLICDTKDPNEPLNELKIVLFFWVNLSWYQTTFKWFLLSNWEIFY